MSDWLERLKGLEQAGTPGPWKRGSGGTLERIPNSRPDFDGCAACEADIRLIASLRNEASRLIALVEAADRLEAAGWELRRASEAYLENANYSNTALMESVVERHGNALAAYRKLRGAP